jgi:hypothetical protein
MQNSPTILRAIVLLGSMFLVCPLARAETAHSLPSSLDDPPPPSESVSLPLNFERHTGDLDEMVKTRTIRALVILNPLGFFYDEGLPKGAMYEALQAFQSFVNRRLHTDATSKVEVTFLPVRIDQLEAALMTGMGDIIRLLGRRHARPRAPCGVLDADSQGRGSDRCDRRQVRHDLHARGARWQRGLRQPPDCVLPKLAEGERFAATARSGADRDQSSGLKLDRG